MNDMRNPGSAALSDEVGDVLTAIRRLIAEDEALTEAREQRQMLRGAAGGAEPAALAAGETLAYRHGGHAALARRIALANMTRPRAIAQTMGESGEEMAAARFEHVAPAQMPDLIAAGDGMHPFEAEALSLGDDTPAEVAQADAGDFLLDPEQVEALAPAGELHAPLQLRAADRVAPAMDAAAVPEGESDVQDNQDAAEVSPVRKRPSRWARIGSPIGRRNRVEAVAMPPVVEADPVAAEVMDEPAQDAALAVAAPEFAPADQATLTPEPALADAAAAFRAAGAGDEFELALREVIREMIQEELHGELGQRFSLNLRSVIRREIADAIGDQLDRL